MFSIRHIHQIEMTSHCNLACRYCPSPKLQRPKLDMTEETYTASLRWARFFKDAAGGRQQELNLAGIGESTIHPEFVRFVFLAREIIGPDTMLALATNGVNMTDELAQAIAPSGIRVWVSLHRPEKAGPAIECLKRAGIIAGVSADPSVSATNWAGQVEWFNSHPIRRPCKWVRGGLVVIQADGNVSRCPLDASGIGVIASVKDDLSRFETSPYELCRTCDQDVGVPLTRGVHDVIAGDTVAVRAS